jgi:hypothetical protein
VKLKSTATGLSLLQNRVECQKAGKFKSEKHGKSVKGEKGIEERRQCATPHLISPIYISYPQSAIEKCLVPSP